MSLSRFCILAIALAYCACSTSAQDPDAFEISSVNTGDAYTILIRKPHGYSKDKSYKLVIVADGSLGLGEYVNGSNENWKSAIPSNCIFITIGHKGDHESKRRRDFIPTDITGNATKDFGKAREFYSFLKEEFLPRIETLFPGSKSRVFVGHSFSGLFSIYAALQEDRLFDHYYAISPSVWANHNELLKIEEALSKKKKTLNGNITLFAGGLEVFNKVLSSTRNFYEQALSRNYSGLQISFEVISNANHFSIRKPAFDKIIASLQEN